MRLFSAPQSPEKDTASSTDEPANPPVPSVQVDGPDDDTSEQPRRAVHVAFTSDTDGDKSKENLNEGKISDVFDLTESPAPDDTTEIEITRTSIELDVLPIELISLTDRYAGLRPPTSPKKLGLNLLTGALSQLHRLPRGQEDLQDPAQHRQTLRALPNFLCAGVLEHQHTPQRQRPVHQTEPRSLPDIFYILCHWPLPKQTVES